jgi:hypothetical protein
MRPIDLDDLVYYLTGVLHDPGAYGQYYDVGNDELLSTNQLIDSIADWLDRRHPIKIQMPLALLAALASPIERLAKLPKGAIKGFVDSLKINMIGDPLPIRAILPQPLLAFRQAVERALMTPRATKFATTTCGDAREMIEFLSLRKAYDDSYSWRVCLWGRPLSLQCRTHCNAELPLQRLSAF